MLSEVTAQVRATSGALEPLRRGGRQNVVATASLAIPDLIVGCVSY